MPTLPTAIRAAAERRPWPTVNLPPPQHFQCKSPHYNLTCHSKHSYKPPWYCLPSAQHFCLHKWSKLFVLEQVPPRKMGHSKESHFSIKEVLTATEVSLHRGRDLSSQSSAAQTREVHDLYKRGRPLYEALQSSLLSELCWENANHHLISQNQTLGATHIAWLLIQQR